MRTRMRMRIAHVVAHRVTAPTSGYAARTWTISRALARAGDLTIVDVGTDPVADESATVALDGGVTARYERVATADLPAWLVAHDLDIVVAGEPALAPGIVGAPGARIVDCQNVESDLWRAHGARSPADERAAHAQRARASELLERSVLPQLDQVWTVSRDDADALGRRVPGHRIEVVPNVAAFPIAADADLESRAPVPGHGVLFGSLWYPPNQDAVTELLAVSDALNRRGQPHRFTVAGTGAPEWLVDDLARAASVTAPGFVPDLGALLHEAAGAVFPMTYGGGSMAKLLTALGAGCPVVTTPDGARGIPELVDGVHLAVRPLGEAFVDAVAALLADPERFGGLGREGARLIRDRYSLDVLDARVAELLASAGAAPEG